MADYSSYECQRQRRTRHRSLAADGKARSGDAGQQKSPPSPSRKRAAHLRALLNKISVQEDLRVVLPNGQRRRAYYNNLDRTLVRSEYRSRGKRVYVYGRIREGKLVPHVDPAESE